MKYMTRYLQVLLLLLALGMAGCITSDTTRSGGDSKQLSSASSFTLLALNGGEVKFPEDFKGHKTALIFFSTS